MEGSERNEASPYMPKADVSTHPYNAIREDFITAEDTTNWGAVIKSQQAMAQQIEAQ